MSEVEELKQRIEAKKHEIQAEIAEKKADADASQRAEIERLEDKLADLRSRLEGGWEDVTESIASRLNDWLKK